MQKVPLRDDDFLLLRGPDSFQPEELTKALAPLGFSAYLESRFSIVEAELKQLVLDQGVSYVWRLVQLREAVLPPGPRADRAPLLKLLDGMIRRLNATRDFLIIDPYLLPSGAPLTYLAELLSLVEPVAKQVTRLLLVTSKGFDAQLLRDFRISIAAICPTCSVSHVVSDRYHDRFWIADQARGLFVGTSLNGIGCRYAVADYLEPRDAREIVDDLKSNGLL